MFTFFTSTPENTLCFTLIEVKLCALYYKNINIRIITECVMRNFTLERHIKKRDCENNFGIFESFAKSD